MMSGQMGGPGNNMRMPGPGPRNAGMQQIPPSGPMMRAQVKSHVSFITLSSEKYGVSKKNTFLIEDV